MERYEKALNKFLLGWKNKKEVIGALVCGSYVTGNPSKHSDIDVHIILSDSVKWRERGNKIVDGFLIEYFANPPKQIKKYFKDDYQKNSRMACTQFVTGRILFDKNNKVRELKKIAKIWIRKKFVKPAMTITEIKKYGLWDNFDNLDEMYEKKSPSFVYSYHQHLMLTIETYAKYLQTVVYHVYKTHAFLTDHKARAKYLQKEFPDKMFSKIFVTAICENNATKMIYIAETLTYYVLKQMGGFDIDGWKVRTTVEE